MYSKIKNIQIIVALMKKHNIRHIVLSAGTRHVPIAHSVENDPFFTCYSVVDERSAGYYALGLCKELGEPVAIACTSSTATCNYTPPIAEAYYQKLPLLVLTGDRDPYRLGQLEDQMINQVDMYRNYCKKCYNLPIVETSYDEWYCGRLVNEAILELTRDGCGPVQINFPINQSIEDIADASAESLPDVTKIERVDVESEDAVWKQHSEYLSSKKRIFVLCGAGEKTSEKQRAAMDLFAKHYSCAFVTEHLSNIHCDASINGYTVAESITGEVVRTGIKPDLVIFFGGNFLGRWKTMFRGQKGLFDSWYICEDGIVVDPFQNLTRVFKCTVPFFFEKMGKLADVRSKNDCQLLSDLQAYKDNIKIPNVREICTRANKYAIDDAKFRKESEPSNDRLVPEGYLSGFGAMQGLAGAIRRNSLLHLSILNSTRITQLFDLPDDTLVYSNLGTDGIDGTMSTFLGQAKANPDKECFLVIGDLSFFYDMNSISIRDIGDNVHIMMINNGGGAEFYLSMGPEKLPNIDMHISAAHSHKAKEWVKANGFNYLEASSQDEFDKILPAFMENKGRPVFLEVSTMKYQDVMVYKAFRRMIHQDTLARKVYKRVEALPVVNKVLNTEVGNSIKEKLKKGFKKLSD